MQESEILKALTQKSEEYRNLGEEHKNLKQLLGELNQRVYLSPDEEMEKKRIQKLKLQKKDMMASLLKQYKQEQGLNKS